MTISFTSNGTTSQILHNGAPALQTDASGNVSVRTGGSVKTIADLQSIGIDQTMQNVTASRAFATTYTNSSNRPKIISFSSGGGTASTHSLIIGGVTVMQSNNGTASLATLFGVVPPNGTYSITGNSMGIWAETN